MNGCLPSKLFMFLLRCRYRSHIHKTYARKFYEYEVLTFYRESKQIQKILLVGICPATQHYGLFFNNKRFVMSIDKDPSVSCFAQNCVHVNDSVVNLTAHCSDENFDLVLMQAVYGWGLDTEEELTKTLKNVHRILNQKGIFLFSWTDIARRDPLHIATKNYFFRFKPYFFKGRSEIKLKRSSQ